MAYVYSVLSMSSVATVLMVGNDQAQAFLRKASSPLYPPPRHSSPQADVDRHRQRGCPREPSTRHLLARQQTAVINSI